MGRYVTENLIKKMIKADINVKGAKVGIFGFTFKENCPDTRNTRIIDIVNELDEYGIKPLIYDPVADKEEAKEEYGIEFNNLEDLRDLDAVIFAVSHEEFAKYDINKINKLYNSNSKKVLIDIKGIYDKTLFRNDNYLYWRL